MTNNKIKTYEIHELANLVPMASKKEFEALKYDIKKNGLKDPVILWENKIVDGRNRQLACNLLGIEFEVTKLDNNLTIEQVANIVKSTSIRRNLTDTQKIMSAYKEQLRTKETNEKIAKSWGVSEKSYKNGKFVAREKPEYIEDLFDGKSVTLFDLNKDQEITTNKINTLARIIKATNESNILVIDASEELDISFTIEGSLKTEIGKDWFYSKKESLGITNTQILMDYVELANLKFKIVDEK